MKCPNCGYENNDGAKFCEDCGKALPPPKKNCPKCGIELSASAKFCSNCGYNFINNGFQSAAAGGLSMGDKNVVAGDVIGSKSEYNVTGNATIIHNDDETKKTARCHICGSIILEIEGGRYCPECHGFTCKNCFDTNECVCSNCVKKHTEIREGQYKMKVIEFLQNDNRIDAQEFAELQKYAEQLKISMFRAMQIQDEIKSNSRSKSELTTFEKLNYEKALDLYYDEGKTLEALKIITQIYNDRPDDERILDLYLTLLSDENPNEAKKVIQSLKFEVLGAFLASTKIAIRQKDFANAELTIKRALEIWPDNTLAKCYNVLYFISLYSQFKESSLLDEAKKLVSSLGEARSKLEISWQIKVNCMVNSAAGEENPEMNKEFCKENNLYYWLLNGNSNQKNKKKSGFTSGSGGVIGIGLNLI